MNEFQGKVHIVLVGQLKVVGILFGILYQQRGAAVQWQQVQQQCGWLRLIRRPACHSRPPAQPPTSQTFRLLLLFEYFVHCDHKLSKRHKLKSTSLDCIGLHWIALLFVFVVLHCMLYFTPCHCVPNSITLYKLHFAVFHH